MQVHLQAEVSLAVHRHLENPIQAKGQTDLSEKKEAAQNAQPVLTVNPKAAPLKGNHSVTANHPSKNAMTIFLQGENLLRSVEKIQPDPAKHLIESLIVKEANALAIVSKNLSGKEMKVLLREDLTATEEQVSAKTKEVLSHVENLLTETERIHHHRAHAKHLIENRTTKEAKAQAEDLKNLTAEETKEVLNLADVLLTEIEKILLHRAHARHRLGNRITKGAKAQAEDLKNLTAEGMKGVQNLADVHRTQTKKILLHRVHAKHRLVNRITKEAKTRAIVSKNLTVKKRSAVLDFADVLPTEKKRISHDQENLTVTAIRLSNQANARRNSINRLGKKMKAHLILADHQDVSPEVHSAANAIKMKHLARKDRKQVVLTNSLEMKNVNAHRANVLPQMVIAVFPKNRVPTATRKEVLIRAMLQFRLKKYA